MQQKTGHGCRCTSLLLCCSPPNVQHITSSKHTETMTMRTCCIIWKQPAQSRLVLSCPSHKSKGSRTKTSMFLENQPPTPAKIHHPSLGGPVATSYHQLPSLTVNHCGGNKAVISELTDRVTMTTQRTSDGSMARETEEESGVQSPVGCHRVPHCFCVPVKF